jgi:quercetin dioxygenase-like cupin family protein
MNAILHSMLNAKPSQVDIHCGSMPPEGSSREVTGMGGPGAPPLTIVRPCEGRTGDLLPGVGVIFKLSGKDTGGALSVVEHPFDVGALVPPHLHTREDEYSIVTEGEIGFRSGDREAVLGPGGYITKPRGELHAMWNAGRIPARMIEIISPAGFEDFFRDLAALVAAGPPAFDTVAALAATYGLTFGDAEWLPDIIARFGLNPLPEVHAGRSA